MNGLGKVVVACLAAAARSACGTKLQKAEKVDPPSGAYDSSLYEGYLGLSKSEYGEGDYKSSDLFALRAVSAAEGKDAGPESLDKWSLPADKTGELSSARSRLIAALGEGAAQKMPSQAAAAQVNFDCWLQEQRTAENFQPDDIAACRDGFYTALAALEEKPVAAVKPEPEVSPLRYVIYFNFDSAEVDEKAKAVIFEAEAAARRLKGSRIAVSGYTDTVGSADYNKVLSELRAGAVSKLMESQGYPAERLSAEGFGKTNLAVPTADGVKEPGNRRAVIYVQPK
jgi:OOP family OmpA-OmpF porin